MFKFIIMEDKHTPEWWDLEYEKCKESLSYFYNKYCRIEGAPVITELDVKEMIKMQQTMHIKLRGHHYYPPKTFIYPDEGLKLTKEDLHKLLNDTNYGKHIIVSPSMETALIEAMDEYAKLTGIKIQEHELKDARPDFEKINKEMLKISKIPLEFFGEEKPSHKPPKGPIHFPKRKKFKKK